MKKNLYKIITIGSAWGIFEATAGYLLHVSGLKIGWMVWFPAAYFFIHMAYRYTDSIRSVMLTALIASSLKCINLFFPGRADMVINPAVSILLEALAVMLVYKYVLNRQTAKINPLTVLLTGVIWRTFYICYILCMPQSYLEIAPFTAMTSFLNYMFFNNVVNAVFISTGFLAAKALQKPFHILSSRFQEAINQRTALKPAFAALSMMLAIVVQVAAG